MKHRSATSLKQYAQDNAVGWSNHSENSAARLRTRTLWVSRFLVRAAQVQMPTKRSTDIARTLFSYFRTLTCLMTTLLSASTAVNPKQTEFASNSTEITSIIRVCVLCIDCSAFKFTYCILPAADVIFSLSSHADQVMQAGMNSMIVNAEKILQRTASSGSKRKGLQS